MYDGTEVSGSEVLNVIRKFSDETMGILVQTNKNKTYYNYNFDVDKGELGKALDNSYKMRRMWQVTSISIRAVS